MDDNLTKLLQTSSKEEIILVLKDKLNNSDEADFWKEKIIPYLDSILSVLLPLKKQNLLFTPEGEIVTILDSKLFYKWADLVCLKTLAFIIQESNKKKYLCRTKYNMNLNYEPIDLEILGSYLSSNKINLIDENSLDFPISIYNLHLGMLSIIKKLLS
jgi:hypothetical protein